MNIKETIEYLKKLLLDESLSPEVKYGIKEAIKKLQRDQSVETLKEVIEIIAALIGIGSDLF